VHLTTCLRRRSSRVVGVGLARRAAPGGSDGL